MMVSFPGSTLLHTWRQAYPRLIFIKTEVVPSPSTNNAHVVIAQYNVVGLFATISSSTTTVAASWLLHIASQVTGTALVAGKGQFWNSVHSSRVCEVAYQDRCFLLTIFAGSGLVSACMDSMTWYELSTMTDILNDTRSYGQYKGRVP